MQAEPTIVERGAQPYVAIKRSITMDTFHEIADRFPEVFAWLEEQGVRPTGPPFFRFNVIDMQHRLEVEAGVPVDAALTGTGEVFAGMLPAGRYATVGHVGHPDELIDVTAALLDWAPTQGLAWDVTETPAGQKWGCRLAVYHTDPAEEPDMAKWRIELVFRLAD